MIQLNSISKSFDEKTVMEQVTLTIEEGSVFGLIGPNGAGKSTLLRIMSGIVEADAGSVLYDGQDVFENVDVKKDIFLISDDPFYFVNASIRDMKDFYHVWYPNLNEDLYKKFLKLFHLDEKKPLRDFSKGMKRQAFMVLALAICPKYLFLDEAFDGLDPVMRLTFKRAIMNFIDDKNMTIVISSHNLRELEDICDCFGILEMNGIITSGKVDETKCHMHKVQMAFDKEMQEEDFKDLDVLYLKIHSRVVNLVVKGYIDEVREKLEQLHPIMLETLNVNLEEVFLFEMDRKGYGVYE